MANATDLDLLINDFTGYLVTPANAFGMGGFLFDVEGDTTVNLDAEITDHFLEDNSAIQDHIALRPKRFTLKGYVGELVDEIETGTLGFVQKAVKKLTVLSAILPTLSQATQQAKEFLEAPSLETLKLNDLSTATDYWAVAKNLANGTSKQQQAYQYFKALWEQKLLTSVQTPFEFVANMAVVSVVAVQDETTRTVSDFTIVLKQIRTVSELTVAQPQQYGPPAPGLSSPTIGPIQNTYSTAPPINLLAQGRTAEQAQALNMGGIMAGTIQPSAVFGPVPNAPGIQLNEQQYNAYIGGVATIFKGANPKNPPPLPP